MGVAPLTHAYADGAVAARYGLEEAVFLDSIVFWWRANRSEGRNLHDGRWWTYNSLSTYLTIFPWWSTRQLRRVITSCREKGALLTGNYNDDRRDRTVWYSPSDELLALYGETETVSCICQNGQMDVTEPTHSFDGSDTPLPCLYHDVTHDTPPIVPPTGGSAELPEADSTPVVSIPLNDGTEFPVTEEQVQEWQKLYPAVDVTQQLRAMRGWALASPKRRKTRLGVMKFINSWLAREQDRGSGPGGGDYWDQMAQRRRDEACLKTF